MTSTEQINKWQEMLRKAYKEGLTMQQIQDDRYLVSSSRGDKYYNVVITGKRAVCNCLSQHAYCKHRALVLNSLGLLEAQNPNPALPPSVFDPTEEELRAWA